MNQDIRYTVLSRTEKLTSSPDSKDKLSSIYKKINWRKNSEVGKLSDIISSPYLITIVTEKLVVIDFDTDDSFSFACDLNASLDKQYRCGLIVKSHRKGGHFYYWDADYWNRENPDNMVPVLPEPFGHTKQSVFDYLSTDKHNVIAPSKGDEGKEIMHWSPDGLTPYNPYIDMYINLLISQNLKTSRAQVIHDDRYSDDAVTLIRGYLSNIVSQEQLHLFYNIPDPIPGGMSNETYLKFSTRLGSDETISVDDYIATMEKFNAYHNRKEPTELYDTIITRMIENKNGLWRYDKDKENQTFTVTHKRFNTRISVYFDKVDQSYLVEYLDDMGKKELMTLPNRTSYLEVMEKICAMKKKAISDKTNRIIDVNVISDYNREPGFNRNDRTYNKALINSNLAAFMGSKPDNYKKPEELLELMEYMWGGEYDYLLYVTQHRYSTFSFSPIVTYLKGTEGSGKDLTVYLLSAGFGNHPQQLNYSLLKDKHSNWQTTENAVFSEIGSWKPMERGDLLSELKSISGSNGKVTFRDMNKVATVVPTLIKIWITSNEWIKLHTDPITQRRIHVVYMPRPLEIESGGPYSNYDMQRIVNDKTVADFYYWLGNEYTPSDIFKHDQYMNAKSRQRSESYELYTSSTYSKNDLASTLLWECSYDKFKEALELFNLSIDNLLHKTDKSGHLVISAKDLKDKVLERGGGETVSKIIDRIVSEKNGNKRITMDGKKQRYVTVYGAPESLKEERMEPLDSD